MPAARIGTVDATRGSGETPRTAVPYQMFTPGAITTSFQTVKIPLRAFSNVSFSTVNVFTVVTTNDSGSGAGVLDGLRVVFVATAVFDDTCGNLIQMIQRVS